MPSAKPKFRVSDDAVQAAVDFSQQFELVAGYFPTSYVLRARWDISPMSAKRLMQKVRAQLNMPPAHRGNGNIARRKMLGSKPPRNRRKR
jgi:hypothetical protein